MTTRGGPPAAARGLGPDDLVAGWSKDGRAAFVTGAWPVPARLERVDLLTGARTLIKELAPPELAGVNNIWVSSVMADGRVYAYSYLSVRLTLYQIDGLNFSREP